MNSEPDGALWELAQRMAVRPGDGNDASMWAWNATKALVDIGPMSIPALVKTFNESDNDTARHHACGAIASIARRNERSLLVLSAAESMLTGISDGRHIIRDRCAKALVSMGPECIPQLEQAYSAPKAKRETRDIIYRIACQIAKKSQDPAAVKFAVREARNEKNRLALLGIVKDVAEMALPDIIASLNSEEPETRVSAANALRKIVKIGKVDVRAVLNSEQMGGEIVEPPGKLMRPGREYGARAPIRRGQTGRRLS